MSIVVRFDLAYELAVAARAAEVFAVLADVPTSASHFPKLARLVKTAANTYRWELEKIGAAQIYIQTVYAARYATDRAKGSVVWTPVEGVGNALIGGSWSIAERRRSTRLVLQIRGEVHVPLPGLMRRVVEPVVSAENGRLIERYVANLADRFGGEV